MSKITILDVAKKSGFAVGTVSRVLSNDKSVKDSTRQKILKVIDELHYIPNVNGARLRLKHSGVIAVMVPVINHPFFSEFVEYVEQIAMENKYSLLLVTSQMNKEREKEILKKIRQKEIDGAIFVTHYSHDEKELINLPLVSIDRHLANFVPCITSNNYDSTKEAIEQLIASGAKKIGYIGTKPLVDSEVLLREKAYLDVIKEHQLEPRFMNEVIDHGEEEKLVDKFLDSYKDLDAIFASNSVLSQIVYSKLVSRGAKFPNDIQLIGYDGLVKEIRSLMPITTIYQPIQEMAKTAFRVLKQIIDEEEVDQIYVLNTTINKGITTK